MALINCPECKHTVSDSALACPDCGFPLAKESKKNEDKVDVNESFSVADLKQWIARDVVDAGKEAIVKWIKQKGAWVLAALGIVGLGTVGGVLLKVDSMVGERVTPKVAEEIAKKHDELESFRLGMTQQYAKAFIEAQTNSDKLIAEIRAQADKAINEINTKKQQVEAESKSAMAALRTVIQNAGQLEAQSKNAGNPQALAAAVGQDSIALDQASKLVFSDTATPFNEAGIIAHGYFLSLASMFAYSSPNEGRLAALNTLRLTTYRTFESSSVRGFVASNDTIAVAAFAAPAEATENWLTNIVITPVRWNWLFEGAQNVGNVHAGFGHAVRDSWDLIATTVATIGMQKRLFVTGHGIGGAIAVLAAVRIASDPKQPRAVKGLFTFGTPRVGTADFAANFRKLHIPTFSVVNAGDPLPKLPSRGWDYYPVGTLVTLDPNGKVVVDARDNSLEGFLNESSTDSIEAHSLLNYIEKLRVAQRNSMR